MGKLRSTKRTYKQASKDWWNNLTPLFKTDLCDTNIDLLGRHHETLSDKEIETLFIDVKKTESINWYNTFNVNNLLELHVRLGGWDLINKTPTIEQQEKSIFSMYCREVGVKYDYDLSISIDKINLDKQISHFEEELFNIPTGTPISDADGRVVSEQVVIDLALKISGLKAGFDRHEETYYQSHKVELYDAVIKTADIYERSLKKIL